MGDTDFNQQGGLQHLSQHETEVFDWLIMEGAANDHTSSEVIPQFALEGLDLFLGCATTDNPDHLAEIATLFVLRGDLHESAVWDQLTSHIAHKPEGIWFDVTQDEQTYVWVVLSFTEVELEQPYLDYRMRAYLNFAQGVQTHLDDAFWLD